MRAIAIGVALLLLAAAGASGSRLQAQRSARLTQKAVEAPLPAGAKKKAWASLTQVVCPSVTGCVATGYYDEIPGKTPGRLFALHQREGKWTPERTPRKSPGSSALTCRSVGSCVALSWQGLVTQAGKRWTPYPVQLPGTTDTIYPGMSGVRAVSCGSPGNCAGVGVFVTGVQGVGFMSHVLLVDRSNGTWTAGSELQLPPDAATTPDRYTGVTTGGIATVVSCPSAGNCVAGGTYADTVGSVYRTEGWIATEQAGTWGPAVTVQLPPDAATLGDPGKAGTSPFFGFTGLSCPSVGNCTAVGGYEDTNESEQGLILTERNGVWLPGIRAPLPRGAAAPIEPNAWDDPLFSISCAGPNDCAATGAWVVPGGKGGYPGTYYGWLLSERHGRWSASKLVLSGKTRAGGDVYLVSTSCPSPDTCVAVGREYNGRFGLIVVERDGKWQQGVRPKLPRNAAGLKKVSNQFHFASTLDAVSCPSAQRCTAVGTYPTRAGNPRGLIISLRLR